VHVGSALSGYGASRHHLLGVGLAVAARLAPQVAHAFEHDGDRQNAFLCRHIDELARAQAHFFLRLGANRRGFSAGTGPFSACWHDVSRKSQKAVVFSQDDSDRYENQFFLGSGFSSKAGACP